MSVAEMLKRSIYLGIGAAAMSADKLRSLADDMVARGEMSSDEAKRMVEDINRRAEEEKQTLQEWINERVARMLQQAGAAQAERVEQLEKRVATLEVRVTQLLAQTEQPPADVSMPPPVTE